MKIMTIMKKLTVIAVPLREQENSEHGWAELFIHLYTPTCLSGDDKQEF
jgi:hypothetical protein